MSVYLSISVHHLMHVCLSGSHYLTKLEKQSILGMWMRSFDARLLHICGFKKTAQMFQYLGYLAVDFLMGTRYAQQISCRYCC